MDLSPQSLKLMATGAVQTGQQLEPLVIAVVDAERMKTIAAIIGDPNPIHFDPSATRALGLGDKTVNQGPINLTWLIETVIRFAGGPEHLVSVKTRFLGNVFAGERFECTGSVLSVDPGAGRAELELHATASGRPVLGATAVISLGD